MLPLALFTLGTNAQDKVWDFGNDTTNWPTASSVSTDSKTVDGLEVVGNLSSGTFATIGTSGNVAFTDGYSTSRRFQTDGTSGGYATALPTSRYLKFPVTGPCVIKIWGGATSNTSPGRMTKISDGNTVLGSYTTADANAALTTPYQQIYTLNYTGVAGDIYIYTGQSSSSWWYKLSVTYDPLSTGSFNADSSVSVYADGNQVFISNVKSNTTVNVYSLTGALVRTIEVASDASFNLESGVYIAKVKSAEGEKSVKLLVK